MNDSNTPTRLIVNLNHGWEFAKGRTPRGWLAEPRLRGDATVSLPHSWNDRDTFQPGTEYFRGCGSYRRVINGIEALARDPARAWFLQIGGFYGTADLLMNGTRIGGGDGQYLGLCVDVTEPLQAAPDPLVGIRLSNRHRRTVLPGIRDPDFVLHGGLAGGVRLLGLASAHFQMDRAHVVCSPGTGDRWFVEIAAQVAVVSGPARAVAVEWLVVDRDGNSVSDRSHTSLAIPPNRVGAWTKACLELDAPDTWSPDTPALYTAIGQLSEGGKVIDEVRIRFGCRVAEFRPDEGFFLNGERVALRGCNRHESMPGFGNALLPGMHRRDAELMKEMGLNFVRLSHYPQSPAFLDACDELGLLVYAEIATWKSVRRGAWLRAACRQGKAMVERDRNHPSVIIWGMGNESRDRKAYGTMRALIKGLDPTRPVTYAENHLYRARRKATVGIPDVWSLNYEFDQVEEARRSCRSRTVIVSECSNYPHAVRGNMEAELRQVKMIEEDLSRIRAKACVAGFALWSFNDYATLRKKRYRRHCGLVDAWRAPKMSAALLQAMFAESAFVRAFGDWSTGSREKDREIHIFTNCDTVEVLLDGRPVSRHAGCNHLVQTVEFRPGVLRVVGTRRHCFAEHSLEPFGEPARAELVEAFAQRDGEGFIALGVRIVDADGRLVTTWNGEAGVTCSGPARIALPLAGSGIPVSGGLGRAVVVTRGSTGSATVNVSVDGLEAAELTVAL